MLTLMSLTLKNFMSVGNITQAVRLNSGDLTLILGENLDLTKDGKAESRNGAGKTTILNALCYVLFGTPLNDIRLDNLVNKDNNKEMLVTLDFRRDQTNYRIERGRKPSVFRFLANSKEVNSSNGEDETQGAKIDTQEAINAVIGITPVLFRQLVALTTYADPFFKVPVSKQREIIEEILGITILSQKAETLREILNGSTKKNITGSRNEVKNEQFRIKTIQESNTRIERTIDEIRLKMLSWQERRNQRKQELHSLLSSYGEIDFDAEIQKLDRIEEENVRRSKLISHKEAIAGEVRALEGDLRRIIEMIELHQKGIKEDPDDDRDLALYEGEISRIDKQTLRLEGEAERLEEMLQSPSEMTCHACGQPLRDGDHLDSVMGRLRSDRDQLREEIQALSERKTSIEQSIDGAMLHRQERQKKVLLENEHHKAEVDRIEKEAITIADKIDEKQSTLSETDDELAKLGEPAQSLFTSRDEIWQARASYDRIVSELEEIETTINPYDDQLQSLQRTLQEVSYRHLNELVRKVEHQEFLLKILTDKNSFIRKTIIEQNLAYLNSRLALHLEEIVLPHQVIFKSDLSVEITKRDKELDFDSLSRGEQNRVLLSLSWAFRDLFENMHVPINCTFIDEVLDFGMDPQGVQEALEVLRLMQQRGKSVFLISHREELVSSVSNVMFAIKENDFTTYDLREAA